MFLFCFSSSSHYCMVHHCYLVPHSLIFFKCAAAELTFKFCYLVQRGLLKGNSHQILLSEMSLPGIGVLIEKMLPKILGRLGKQKPSKRRQKVAFVQRKCYTISIHYVQLVKQNLVYACRAAVSVARYVYAFRNIFV